MKPEALRLADYHEEQFKKCFGDFSENPKEYGSEEDSELVRTIMQLRQLHDENSQLRAALAHRDAQAQQVNQQMLEAIRSSLSSMSLYGGWRCEKSIRLCEQAIAAAEAMKGG